MRAYKYLWVVTLSILALAASAQQTVELRGTVLEKGTDEPLIQATIRLLNVKDSTLVRGVSTQNDGSFTVKNLKPGNYLLNATYVGFDPLYQPLQITGQVNPVNVGKLYLTEGILLEGVEVVAKAPEMVVRNDTIEYNADSYKVAEGSVLEELLKKMPGVEIGSDGKITVNGKEVKKMLVDGKEFFSDDPKVASKNLPTKMIDKVQVLDRRSDMAQMTGFDDGDEETVINLTIKPGMKQGWFGNAYAGYGSEERYEVNAMVNRFVNNDQLTLMGGANNTNNMGFTDLASSMFSGMSGMRRGGRGGGGGAGNGITQSGNGGLNFSKGFSSLLTLGGNARYAHSDNEALSKSNTQNILSGDSSSYYNENNFSSSKSDNIGANFRLEWKPDTLTRIIFTPNFSYNHNRNTQIGEFNTLDNELDTVNVGKSAYLAQGEGYNLSGTLDYSRKLNSEGRVFSASVSGGYSDSYNRGTNLSETRYYQLAGPDRDERIDQQFRYDNNGYNYRVFLSWVEPVGHNNFIQGTYSISQQQQESLKKTYTQDEYGEYSVLDTAYSKSYRNTFLNQRISIAFKSQREKYNYTVGFNVDPSFSKSTNFVGDSTLYQLQRHVVNFSPTVQFNYLFDKRTNLRINYNGRTSQPSMTQLQPVADISDPLNTTIGNPDLKPKYTNDLSIRFQKFSPERQQAFMLTANGSYTLNEIVSKTLYDSELGKKTTTYENMNGNWSANLRAIYNSPFINRHFSFNTMTMFSFNNANGYVNSNKNISKSLTLSERLGVNYQSDVADLGVTGSFRYNGVNNSLQGQQDQNTFNYTVGGNTTLYLPWDFRIESDINYSTNSGYAAGYQQNEVLWNAALSKQFLKNNQGTLRFKIYDILKQRSNISRSVTASYIQDSEYNTLGSYFMFHFIYRFSIFKGTQSAPDMRRGQRGGFGGGPGGGRPGDGPAF